MRSLWSSYVSLARLTVLAVCLSALAAAPAAALEPGETAAILAGTVAPAELPADAQLSADAYAAHRTRMERAWQLYDDQRGRTLNLWTLEHVDLPTGGTVFYPFSGPDFVTPHRFYPHADRYVMVAMQIAGRPPDFGLSTGHSSTVLEVFRQGASQFGDLGYFITEELYEEFQNGAAVEGITGMLMLMAVREGHEVISIVPIRTDEQGEIVEIDPAQATASDWASVRLRMRDTTDERDVILDYLRLNLGDAWLDRHAGDAAFIRAMAANPMVFKAASHMPETGWFETLVTAALENSPLILQDETGIPYDRLVEHFDVTLYGNYTESNGAFTPGQQPSLRAAYLERQDIEPLPFDYGYNKPAGSCLTQAVRAPQATP